MRQSELLLHVIIISLLQGLRARYFSGCLGVIHSATLFIACRRLTPGPTALRDPPFSNAILLPHSRLAPQEKDAAL